MAELQKAPWSDWETVSLIGRGSFGTVYEIQRKLVDDDTESAALKVITIPQNPGDVEEMYNEGYDDESITATFNSHLKSIVAEYRLMQKMDGSANVVNCKDIRYIQHDDGIGWDIYIRMELLTPLMKALPVDADEATVIRIGKDICNALVLCKKHEIVHRDIKPQNIFVSANGDYKLGDFGIAKTVEKTMGGTKIGTYKYMAPEVYNNQPYGSAADIYSLGLVLYWLLNERRMPFMPLPPAKIKAGQDEEARHRRLSGEKLPAPAHGSDALQQIVLKACAYDPKDRYSSAAAMLDDLSKLSGGGNVVPPSVISDEKTEEMQEDELTTGPVFGDEHQKKTDASEEDEAELTVGLIFGGNQKKKEDDATGIDNNGASTLNEDSTATKKKVLFFRIVTIVFGILAIILLFFLLRSCNGDKVPTKEQITESSKETQEPTIPTESVYVPPVQSNWSELIEKLPSYVTDEYYDIQKVTLYSTRTLETTSSTETNEMDGWELYDTVEANGGYGPWSDWTAAEATASGTRQVETQTRYRYRTKETSTGTSSIKNGWTLYDTTYSWGNYGSWSSWSTSAVSNSDSRKVETKTQYRYRSISYSTEYTSWSGWSDWTFDRQSTNDLKKEDSRTVWSYYRYVCPRCGAYMHGNACYKWAGGSCSNGSSIDYAYCQQIWSEYSPDDLGYSDFKGTGDFSVTLNGETWFVDNGTSWSERYNFRSNTQYRYATRSTQQVTNYGNWSTWGDTAYSNSSSRQVETRTVYRYCDRSQVATYHFYRWGSWSNWSETQTTATSDRQVERATYYRYRDQIKTTTYFFRRWTDWTEYSDSAVTPSENVEVRTITRYRYKSKDC